MAERGKTSKRRFDPRPVDRFGARRQELAEGAIQTLAALGYARTSLREIAQNTEFSHGSLHYYFEDKLDLILCCVAQYKRRCIAQYDALIERCHTADEIRFGLARALSVSVRDDGLLHRLWFDLRSQSLFEDELRLAVLDIDHQLEEMIWRFVTTFAEYSGGVIVVDSHLAYSMLDGLFQRALLHHLGGRDEALDTLQRTVADVMLTMVKVD